MIDKYKEKLEVEKEVLNALPRNNAKNKTSYKEKVQELLNSSLQDIILLENEIKKRQTAYMHCEDTSDIDKLSQDIDDLYNKLPLCNKYGTSYEKSNLNKMLYKLGHFYMNNIEQINKEILEILKIFKEVNITLTKEDFDYSYYSNIYMNKFIETNNNPSISNETLNEFFKEIFWKCPDIITHITLTFKYLYYKNQKQFDNYYNSVTEQLLSSNLNSKYKELIEIRQDKVENSRYILLTKFLNKELDINNYTEDKINNSYKAIIEKNDNPDIDKELKNFLYTLFEYKKYLDLNYIIEQIKKAWQERDKYKNISSMKKKEISKEEKELFKINKKVNSILNKKTNRLFKLFNKGNQIDNYNNLANEKIKKLKELYSQLEENIFLEAIGELTEDNNLYDVLCLFSSNYNYLVNTVEKVEKNLDEEINKLNEILSFPYIKILNNTLIGEEKNIIHMILDRYNLFNFNITEESLELDNIELTINNVTVILNSMLMNKLNITANKIKFVENSKNILDKPSN